MYMTINTFSAKTGLPPSTLRFYDRKQLLVPARRMENGYRAYTEEQVSPALMIHSLRQAGIRIEDIRRFLQAAEQEKHQLIAKWRYEVEEKLTSLRIAKQYLGGIGPRENHIHLLKWEEEATFIWFPHTVPRKTHPFRQVMKADAEEVRRWGNRVSEAVFIRTLGSKGKTMTGEVGFLLEGELNLPTGRKQDAYIQTLEPTLFATLECNVADDFLCFQMMQMLRRYDFEARGVKLEKFASLEDQRFQYMIPLIQMDKNMRGSV
jgi:DNA-binding transcriptional MerR regulator